MCLASDVMMSRQFKVTSLSLYFMKRAMMMSTSLEHFIIWCSLPLMNERFLIIRMICFMFSLSSSSLTSVYNKEIFFLLSFLIYSSLSYCSIKYFLGFLPLYLGLPLSSYLAYSLIRSSRALASLLFNLSL